jgi:hypothetical protein
MSQTMSQNTKGHSCGCPFRLIYKETLAPHGGHSSQLVFDANKRNAQFLPGATLEFITDELES